MRKPLISTCVFKSYLLSGFWLIVIQKGVTLKTPCHNDTAQLMSHTI